jgi:hypothetical protein
MANNQNKSSGTPCPSPRYASARNDFIAVLKSDQIWAKVDYNCPADVKEVAPVRAVKITPNLDTKQPYMPRNRLDSDLTFDSKDFADSFSIMAKKDEAFKFDFGQDSANQSTLDTNSLAPLIEMIDSSIRSS